MVSLEKTVEFSAAHIVHTADVSSPCRQLHGHNWKVCVGIKANNVARDGMIIDFRDIKDLIMLLDHKFIRPACYGAVGTSTGFKYLYFTIDGSSYSMPLSTVCTLDIPSITSEHLAQYFASKIHDMMSARPGIDIKTVKVEVTVYETSTSSSTAVCGKGKKE